MKKMVKVRIDEYGHIIRDGESSTSNNNALVSSNNSNQVSEVDDYGHIIRGSTGLTLEPPPPPPLWKKRLLSIILLCFLALGIFFLVTKINIFQGAPNEFPVSIRQLTDRSVSHTSYTHREDPEYYVYPEERPLLIKLDAKYNRFHFGYYLYYDFGSTAGLRLYANADGRMVYDTGYMPLGSMSISTEIIYIDLDVEGVQTLEICADYNGMSGTLESQHAVVINAYAYNNTWDICVVDDARVLKFEQIRKMEEKAHELRRKYGIDFMFITTGNGNGGNLQQISDSYYKRYRYNSYTDRIIVYTYFDGKTTGLGYYTKVYTDCNIFFNGPNSINIQNRSLSGQGLKYFWSSMDSQEYNSAFLNILYSVEDFYGK